MIDKIIHTIKAFGLQNNEGFLASEEKAEMEAEITYLEKLKEYMKGDFSYVNEIENLKDRIDMLQDALIEATIPGQHKDQQVTRRDFIEMYNKCLDGMFDEDNKDIENGPYEKKIYLNHMYVHWNGMYCDCSSGAIIANEMIPTIESIDDEEGDGV